MTDPTNTPALSQVQAAPVASPTPSQPSGAQGPPPSTAEAGGWYAKVDGAMGYNKADPPNPGGTGQPQPGDQQRTEPTPGDHGEPPSSLQTALPPRTYEASLPENWSLGPIDPAADRTVNEFLDLARGDHNAAKRQVMATYQEHVQRMGQQYAQYQRDTWNRTIESFINDAKSDPNIGGQRFETTLSNAKYSLQNHLGLTPNEVQQLLVVMDNGGVSSHRLLLKALNNLYERNVPRPVEGQTPAASKLMSNSGGRDWYSQVDNPQQNVRR